MSNHWVAHIIMGMSILALLAVIFYPSKPIERDTALQAADKMKIEMLEAQVESLAKDTQEYANKINALILSEENEKTQTEIRYETIAQIRDSALYDSVRSTLHGYKPMLGQ